MSVHGFYKHERGLMAIKTPPDAVLATRVMHGGTKKKSDRARAKALASFLLQSFLEQLEVLISSVQTGRGP